MKPVLFVTSHAPPYRVGAFQRLHEREGIELALFGGRSLHGPEDHTPPPSHTSAPQRVLPVPHRYISQRDLGRLAASGDYRAVVASTGGRTALPATWIGARRARVPLLLWASLWAHPRSAAHALSYLPLLRLYRSADAVVTYGAHVSAYVNARGARNVHIAPQAVDNDFWRDPAVAPPREPQWPSGVGAVIMFGGRAAREKGIGVLKEAWCASGLGAPAAALVLVGVGSGPGPPPVRPTKIPSGGAVDRAHRTHSGHSAEDIICLDPVDPPQMRNFYAASDVLVLPSIPTRTFREPWGLVVNEAMNRNLPVIVSDAVGAAAGGLVRHERNGLVVPAGDPLALGAAMRRLAGDAPLRARLGAAGASDVLAYTQGAWAEGFSRALASVGASASLPSEGAASVRRS